MFTAKGSFIQGVLVFLIGNTQGSDHDSNLNGGFPPENSHLSQGHLNTI